MQSVLQKKYKWANQRRQKDREAIRRELRQKMIIGKMEPEGDTLISITLEMFWDMNHSQLLDNSEKIIQVIESTLFEELSDEQHYFLVTDLLYLIHQKVIPVPQWIRFKKNEDINTAALVAFISEEILPEELVYWVKYMNDEQLQILFSMVEGEEENSKKWVLNQDLFMFLVQNTKFYTEAAVAFKSLLNESDDLTKKQVQLSMVHIHKGLQRSREDKKEGLHSVLVSIWLNILSIFIRLKQSFSRLQFMQTVFQHQATQTPELLFNLDILTDLNQLYQQQLNLYLPAGVVQALLPLLLSRLKQPLNDLSSEQAQYFLNTLFRAIYNDWLSRSALNKEFKYSEPSFYQNLAEIEGMTQGGIWLKKLKNTGLKKHS